MSGDKIYDAVAGAGPAGLGCYIPLIDAEPQTDAAAADKGGLTGTTPALEPSTEPNPPLTAAAASALLAKEIG